MGRDAKTDQKFLSLEPDGVRAILSRKESQVLIPLSGQPPSELVTSRFLAKAALELMAGRLQTQELDINCLIDDPLLDPIRRHAREGHPRVWPHSVRRIYDANRSIADADGNEVQTVHESDFLQTTEHQIYCVIAIFGLEFAINIAGPSIDGYHRWLEANQNASPLYHGKNAI